MTATAQEVIFYNQLIHTREGNARTGFARRKWKQNFEWVPKGQRCAYGHMDRVYKESREKYGEDLYRELAQMKRLNKRLYEERVEFPLDFSSMELVKKVQTTNGLYGLLPRTKYDTCFVIRGYKRHM